MNATDKNQSEVKAGAAELDALIVAILKLRQETGKVTDEARSKARNVKDDLMAMRRQKFAAELAINKNLAAVKQLSLSGVAPWDTICKKLDMQRNDATERVKKHARFDAMLPAFQEALQTLGLEPTKRVGGLVAELKADAATAGVDTATDEFKEHVITALRHSRSNAGRKLKDPALTAIERLAIIVGESTTEKKTAVLRTLFEAVAPASEFTYHLNGTSFKLDFPVPEATPEDKSAASAAEGVAA
jgi:hypothetical protein